MSTPLSALPPSLIPGPHAPVEPAYEWRGLMLDSARTFWPPAVVIELLDVMARYRFNRLHWHLTDDAGWRLPVPGWPNLVQVGAHLKRPRYDDYTNVPTTKIDEAARRSEGLDITGFYTHDDIRRIVTHARGLGIDIIPEVDLPGHMGAAIRAYPELGNPALKDGDPHCWTDRNDILWPSATAFTFIEDVLATVCDLFPFGTVHVGGDECRYSAWEADPDLAARYGAAPLGIDDPRRRRDSQRGGITGLHPEPSDAPGERATSGFGALLQSDFTDHARAVLDGHGRRVAGWDEMASTSLRGDEILFAWRGERGVADALASGHAFVLADARTLYLNRVEGEGEHEPPGMDGAFTSSDIIAMPIPDSAHMLGIQAAVWTEFIVDREHLHYQLFPRLLAVAELAWCGASLQADDVEERLRHELDTLAHSGVVGRPLHV